MSRIFIWLESSSTLNFILEKKNEYVSQHTIYAFVNVHNSRAISWIAAFGQ